MYNLVIVGNGFDIAHGISSTYQSFGGYLHRHDKHLAEILKLFIDRSELSGDPPDIWGDFENNLAHVNLQEISDHYFEMYRNDEMFKAWNSREAMHAADSFASSCENAVDELTSGLKFRLREWIEQLVEPTTRVFSCIDENDFVISFNYTRTVEKLYYIGNSNIYYIHNVVCTSPGEMVGYVSFDRLVQQDYDLEADIVFGHGARNREPEIFRNPIPSMTYDYDNNNAHSTMKGAYQRLNEFFDQSRKRVDLILPELHNFLGSIGDIDKVFILGHSLSLVDMPYFEKISSHYAKSIEYHISYFTEKNRIPIELQAEAFVDGSNPVFYYDLSDQNSVLFNGDK